MSESSLPFRPKGLILSALTLLVGAALVMGCGDDDSSSTDTSSSAGSGSADSAAKEAAQRQVAKLSELTGVNYPQPTEPVKPGSHRMAIVTCGNAASACLNLGKSAKAAADAIGWETSEILDGEFTPSVVSGHINDAVERGYDALYIGSFDVPAIKAAVDNALKNEVKIVCTVCVGNDPEAGVIDVGTDGYTDGRALGTYIAANAEEGDKILIYDDPAYASVQRRTGAMIEEIEKACPSCEIEKHDVATADLAKPGPPFFTAALSSNPKGSIDWVVAPYGTIGQPMLKTITDQGRDEIKLVTYDAIAANTDKLKQGGTALKADIGTPLPYFSWASVDLLARQLAGEPIWDNHGRMPVTLLTEENVGDAELDASSGQFEPSGFDYKSMFQELWNGSGA